MKIENQRVSKDILNQVRANYLIRNDMMDDLGKLLKLSRSGLYSKLNGRTNFTFNELLQICRHYQLSLDYFVYREKREETPYAFLSDAVYIPNKSFDQFLENYLDHLDQLKKFSNVKGSYLCNEIPFFYYLQFPELLVFKMYVWHMTSWQIPKYNSKFSLDLALKNIKLHSTAKEISKIYMSYNTIEIWNPRMLNPIIEQINYFLDLNMLSDKDATILLKTIKSLIDFLEKQLKIPYKILHGSNKKGANIKIYNYDIGAVSELIVINSQEFNTTYLSFDTPNYLRSYDNRISDYSIAYMNKIISFSTQINVTGLKERIPLLNKFKDGLNSLEK